MSHPIKFIDPNGMYEGEAGSFKKGDKDFNNVLAYWGIGQGGNSGGDGKGNGDKDKEKDTSRDSATNSDTPLDNFLNNGNTVKKRSIDNTQGRHLMLSEGFWGLFDKGLELVDLLTTVVWYKDPVTGNWLSLPLPQTGAAKGAYNISSFFGAFDVYKLLYRKPFKAVPGIYIHFFASGKVYVGQGLNLMDRPLKSLKDLLNGRVGAANDTYVETVFIPVTTPSGGVSKQLLGDMEDRYIRFFGGHNSPRTYNQRAAPGHGN